MRNAPRCWPIKWPAALHRYKAFVENFNPPGLRNYWKSNYLQDLSDGAIDVLVTTITVPAPHTHVVIEHLGGAVWVGEDETAVDHREALYNFLIVGMWTDARMRR